MDPSRPAALRSPRTRWSGQAGPGCLVLIGGSVPSGASHASPSGRSATSIRKTGSPSCSLWRRNLASHLSWSRVSVSRESMARDPTSAYFVGTDRDRAAFEAGIKLGSIPPQDHGGPLTREKATSLERGIGGAAREQPLVRDGVGRS